MEKIPKIAFNRAYLTSFNYSTAVSDKAYLEAAHKYLSLCVWDDKSLVQALKPQEFLKCLRLTYCGKRLTEAGPPFTSNLVPSFSTLSAHLIWCSDPDPFLQEESF